MANKLVISVGQGGLQGIYTNVPDLIVYMVDADWPESTVISGPFGLPPHADFVGH